MSFVFATSDRWLIFGTLTFVASTRAPVVLTLTLVYVPPLCVLYFTTLMTTVNKNPVLSTTSNLVYDGALLFWRTVVNLFFREVRPRGAFNIPREGPVIFAAAPHHNQVSEFLTPPNDTY